jgi:hypothetical protein
VSIGRRAFLYTIALTGLLITLASLLLLSSEAMRLLSSGIAIALAGAALARESAAWFGLGLAGLILWAVGWFPANGAARQLTLTGAAERASTIRKAYLYTGQLVTLAVGLIEAGLMTADLLRRAIGETPTALAPWPGSALARAAGVLVAFVLWGHLRWAAVHDGDFGREPGRSANWRRAYFYLAAAGGFALVIVGALGYLRAMLGLAGSALLTAANVGPDPISTAAVWRGPIVSSVAELVVGIPLAILIWSTASRLAAGAPAREYSALSRATLLHAGLLFGAAASLVSTAYLLQQTLLLLTGGTASTELAWSNMITALVCLPVGTISWLAFASAARSSAALSPAAPGAVAIRRLTFYLLAAAGLAAFSVGMALLWQVIFSSITGSAVLGRFSQGAALVLVSAPAWWATWWPRQVSARQAGPQGRGERSSTARKVYLVGVITAAAAVLVVSLLALAVRGVSVSMALAAGGVALFWLIAHMLILRGDRRWQAGERWQPTAPPPAGAVPAAEPASGARSFRREELAVVAASGAFAPPAVTPRPVVVIDTGDGSLGAGLLAALRSALPQATLWPVGLNPAAQRAMLAALGDAAPPAVPPDALARAAAVVGPSDMLLPGGLGGEVSPQLLADLAVSRARLILLPSRYPRLRWVAAPDWPVERWIENTVVEVSNVVQ